MRILGCFLVLAVFAVLVASGCRSEQAVSPTSGSPPTSTAKGDEVAVRGEDEAEGPPPILQIPVVATAGADRAGFKYAPPLDPNPSMSGEEAMAQAWGRGFAEQNRPSSVTAVLANVTWGENSYLRKRLRGRDVWVVTYPDTCNTVFDGQFAGVFALRPQARTDTDQATPADPGVDCVVQSFSSIIDAKTGEWYTSFTPASSLG